MPPKADLVRKKKTYASKSSDRRLASGKRAEAFLHGAQNKIANSSSGSKSDKSADGWNPKHFRLFVGNLGEDANDEVLAAAFARYPSVSKVRVPEDKSGKNRGYGFVAFASPDDYLKAFKEMNGKYVGSRPVQLKRAEGKPK
ncbi:hypothetical protein JCM33374_g3326 [Metschnikowia sp. JCM 33374]|nr:hypothetical protein JCM33374_g3326 [Metschnikowia sp. JCM 33374]